MKAPPFAYVRAASLADAFRLVARGGARREAAGRRAEPARHPRLPPVRARHADRHLARAGAARHLRRPALRSASARSPRMPSSARNELVRRHVPLLAEAVPLIAHAAIRNRGTIGGSLAFADPAAELPACCVALDARSSPAAPPASGASRPRSSSPASTRRRCATDELIAAVEFPMPQAGERSDHPGAGAPLRRLRHGRHRRQGASVDRQHAGRAAPRLLRRRRRAGAGRAGDGSRSAASR